MNYEEYLNRIPNLPRGNKQKNYEIFKIKYIHHCPNCQKDFNKPKTKTFGSFLMEVGLLIV